MTWRRPSSHCRRHASSSPPFFLLLLFSPLLLLLLPQPSLAVFEGNGVPHDLTPELVEQLRVEKETRYFVKLISGPCNASGQMDICAYIDANFWTPIARMFPQEIWTSLDCNVYPALCNEISTAHRVAAISGQRTIDFMTIMYSEDAPNNRLAELYRGSEELDVVLQYYQRMIADSLPFEAMHPDYVSTWLSMTAARTDESFGRPVSMAILVLTMDGFTRPEVWKDFFRKASDSDSASSLRIFVHAKENQSQPPIDGTIAVPSVFSDRHTVALVRPILQMLRYAVGYGGATHYLLVSGDSVPLLAPKEMVERLAAMPPTNRFERHSQDMYKVLQEMRQQYPGEFLKSKSWVVWNDETARFFADPKNDFTNNFEIVSMADEYYWINVAQEYNISWQDLPFMYDEWPIQQAGHPNILSVVNSLELSKDGHLFARKVTQESILQLHWMPSTGGTDEL